MGKASANGLVDVEQVCVAVPRVGVALKAGVDYAPSATQTSASRITAWNSQFKRSTSGFALNRSGVGDSVEDARRSSSSMASTEQVVGRSMTSDTNDASSSGLLATSDFVGSCRPQDNPSCERMISTKAWSTYLLCLADFDWR